MTFPSASSSTSEGPEPSSDDAHYLRKFLPCWRMLFPWAEYEEGETEIVYCHDCRKASWKNEFARGKGHLQEDGRRNTFIVRRHADSRDHTKHTPWLLVQ